MRHAILLAVLLTGCGREVPSTNAVATNDVPSEAGGWDLQTNGEGAALLFSNEAGNRAIRLSCPAGGDRLVVNVPAFEPIGSEDRLSFGQSGEVVALVADPSGGSVRGGVTAEGPVPSNLVALLSGQVSASYGSQASGPHPTPPAALVNSFASACTGDQPSGGSAEGQSEAPPREQADVSACLIGRDGRQIPPNRIRAVGTEPFWAARVEGRCVTYSHPDNQDGTRVWTEFSGTAENGTWSGYLEGERFVMRTRPQQGCSDGMSDKRYPIAVSLTVSGEERTGCAEPR